jgi:beta-lactamase regulating signal transducer with metallopeptidase domain
MNGSIDVFASALVLLALHATVLLGLVWALERLGGLKHPGWAEFAWRAALFGAFFSAAFELASWNDPVRSAWPASDAPAVAASADGVDASADASASANTGASIGADIGTNIGTSVVANAGARRQTDTRSDTTDRVGPAAPSQDSRGIAGVAVMPAPASIAASAYATAVPRVTQTRSTWVFDGTGLSNLLLAWLLGAAVSALWIARQAFGLRRWKRRMRRRYTPVSASLQALSADLAQGMGIRTPRVHVLPELAGPLVFSNTVLLPAWAEGLDRAQQTAMLAHELAHLRRRDPLWRPLQRIALIPLFFHPLAWYAVRRLENLAETLCDRAAVERSGNARALAECLAECLARQSERRNPMWAVAMAEHSGGIVGRVHQLLETSSMKFAAIPKRWRWGAAVAVLALLLALPGVFIVAREHNESLSITYRQGGQFYRMVSSMPAPGDRLQMHVEGEVEFDARETDVVRLGPLASVDIEETRGATTHSIRIVGRDGKIVRHYTRNGVERPLDAEGRAWLAQQIPAFFRLSGFDAERRSKRLLSEGGPMRLLGEIDAIGSDGVRVEYLGQLFAQAKLDAAQLVQALQRIEAIESDFEKRRALEKALERDLLSAPNVAQLLALSGGIGSDFERAEWLSRALPKFEIVDAERPLWSKTLQAFGSDFEHRRTLERMIEVARPQATAMTLALASARSIDSDFERRTLLEKAAASGIAIVDSEYLQVVDGMSSDFEQREALLALIRSGMPSRERCDAILRSAKSIESEFERGEVLNAIAEKMPDEPELIRAYRALTRNMSDHARGAAERALDRFANG